MTTPQKENTKLVQGQATGMPLGVVVVWALQHFAGVPIPAEVGAAIGSVLAGVMHRFFGRRKRDEL